MTENHYVWLGEAISLPSDRASVSEELSIKGLRKIQSAAWVARVKWYNIGLELDIDPGTLDSIKANNVNIEDCFRAMLTSWLKVVRPKPTLTALAEALQSPTVGYGHLAEQLYPQN